MRATIWRGLRGRFDLIVEDVFVGSGRGVHKPDWLAGAALARLRATRLAPGGLLVSNSLDEAPAVARAFARLFPAACASPMRDYDNRVLVGRERALHAPPRCAGRWCASRCSRPALRAPARAHAHAERSRPSLEELEHGAVEASPPTRPSPGARRSAIVTRRAPGISSASSRWNFGGVSASWRPQITSVGWRIRRSRSAVSWLETGLALAREEVGAEAARRRA